MWRWPCSLSHLLAQPGPGVATAAITGDITAGTMDITAATIMAIIMEEDMEDGARD